MSGVSLYDYQMDAVNHMKNGCILCGGVGSGKSRTSLAYYYIKNGGVANTTEYVTMTTFQNLYIITTARKRDTLEWEGELGPFLLSTNPDVCVYNIKVTVDSWNNIGKYSDVTDAFFIFDEQRVVGSGAWVKSFLKIAKYNEWILLSATPGDKWEDYIPVFLANGFYKNKTEFTRQHLVYSRFSQYPKVEKYISTGRLIRLRNDILVDMDFHRDTVSHHEEIPVRYDVASYKDVCRYRTNPYAKEYVPSGPSDPEALQVGSDISPEQVVNTTPYLNGIIFEGDYVRCVNKPIKNASEFCYTLRRIVNSDMSRIIAIFEILEKSPRVIIFYNFDYELDILKNMEYGPDVVVAEWNGHYHNPIPDSEKWVYLVQYNAGAEGWNCIKTNTIIFYSQNYSYKIMQQSAGRIDRLNTPYKDLYYYHLASKSGIDLAISKALREKKQFNERKFASF